MGVGAVVVVVCCCLSLFVDGVCCRWLLSLSGILRVLLMAAAVCCLLFVV